MTHPQRVFETGVVSLLDEARKNSDWILYEELLLYIEESGVGLIADDDGHLLVFETPELL